RFLEEPDALLVQEVLAAQGPDRAQIDDIAGQLVVHRLAGEDVDLFAVAAVGDHQFAAAADFAREADAARTHDAAVAEQCDVLADVRLVGRQVFGIDHPASGAAEAVAVVLQLALAGLVAHRAVERVIEEQRFQRLLLRLAGLVAVGDNDGAVLGGHLAAGHHARLHGHAAVRLLFAHFDQAHAAAGDDRQRGV